MHVHLGMRGRWRSDPAGRGRARRGGPPSLRLDVAGRAARLQRRRDRGGCTAASSSRRTRSSRGSAPICSIPRFDPEAVVERARRGPASLGELLLDQRVACGIGNVYRSEVLFVAGLHPGAAVASLADRELADVYAIAARLMRQNLGPGRRCTVREVSRARPLRPGETRHFVYRRRGRPCLRCGAPVASRRQGDAARSVFWCPRCQPGGRG